MREIPLTKGKIARVSDEDFESLSQFKWHAYEIRIKGKSYGFYARSKRLGLMHRAVARALKGQIIDHDDRDTLNNQRTNLRLCSHGENMRHRAQVGSTGFKGVRSSRSPYSPWAAVIRHEGKRYRLGNFATVEGAARAYDVAARKLHGEFALTNEAMGNFLTAKPKESTQGRSNVCSLLRCS